MGFFSYSPDPVDVSKTILRNYYETNEMEVLFGNFKNFIHYLIELYHSNEDYINKNVKKERIGEAGYYNLPKLIKSTSLDSGYLMAYTLVFSSIANSIFLIGFQTVGN